MFFKKFTYSDKKTIVAIKSKHIHDEELVIPEGVEKIGTGAIRYSEAKRIILPSTLKEIGAFAFKGCTELEELILPKSVEIIDDNAFIGCIKLNNINLSRVKYIGSNAFAGCLSLKKINIPNTVVSIGYKPFEGCKFLQNITIAKNNPIFSDKDCDIIFDKARHALIQGCFNSKIPEDTEIIGGSAFEGIIMNNNSINIPAATLKIEDRAFYCSNLAEITFDEGVKIIGDYAFGECYNLEAVNLPHSLEIMGDGLFIGSKNLKKVIIRDGVYTIGAGMFNYCDSLNEIYLYNKGNFEKELFNPENDIKIYVIKKDSLDFDFLSTYHKQIKELTLNELINQGKSFNEANKTLKNIEFDPDAEIDFIF